MQKILYQGSTLRHDAIREQGHTITPKSIAVVCYFLFWLLKPFYIFESGSIQPGDAFLGISFALVLLGDNFGIRLRKIDKHLLTFFLCIFIINFIYYSFSADSYFLKVNIFYVFNFLAIYLFREFAIQPTFFKSFAGVLKINIIIQFAILITGYGNWYGGSRYMGTYNDPNQLAFGVLSTYCLLFCLSRIVPIRHKWLYFAMSVYLIYESASTGMILAILLLFVCEQYFRFFAIKKFDIKILYIIYLMLITVALAYLAIKIVRVLLGEETDIYFLERFSNKLSQNDSVIESFIADRNLYPLLNKPQYILFGSGEGMMRRFSHSGTEIHSTWLGLLFYYGIAPFCAFIAWIRQNMKRVDLYIIPVYICVFLEAFTLVNHRQPSFWTLIVLASVIKRKDLYKSKNIEAR